MIDSMTDKAAPRTVRRLWRWFDRNILELGREMRWSYLPPLMVYAAAGISGLTNIVGTFFVKDYLSLSAEFLAALAFWAGIPLSLIHISEPTRQLASSRMPSSA